ncbi:hypothetical protein VA7868_00924 [Vibrio aerogenes CECT 7868]|uniref:DUF1240 domain-containing protein n=1 Tax=Vibrio aerogenes CECT 7868 TaxID=1216006 RepID=A0A1M5WY98_9VIBR|nr:hypothetical protein [Vibrio aerogenes]SHH92491.1 hypothetical protein VA7868_00924 [Vibrio aerogenes CECT 7868]
MIGVILFGCCCVFTISVFSISFYRLIKEMIDHSSVIEFSQSLMYFAGAGLGTLILFLLSIFHKKMPPVIESLLNRALISSLVVMFIFPHIIGFFVDNFMSNNHYVYCEVVSTHSARYRHSVYTSDIDTCIGLIERKREHDEQ